MRNIIKKYPIIALLTLSVLVHLPGLTSPLLDYHAYRQCQTASMARNYVRHGMHFLQPELDTEGPPRRAGTEFPIYSYLLAILFKLFSQNDLLGHLLSSLFAAWGAVYLYLFIRPRLGPDRALASGLVLSVLPIHVYFTRSVQPEPMALWGLLGFLYYFDRWMRDDKERSIYWLWALLLGSIAPLLKLPFLYLLIPMWAFLSWEFYGIKRTLAPPWLDGILVKRRPLCVQLLIMILGLTWAWYHFANSAPVGVLPLTALEHLKNLRPVLTFKLWENHFISRLPELCFTYAGLVFAFCGVRALYREGVLRFWAAWFGVTALYIVLLGEYGQIHRYTELPFAPICAVLIGSGIVALWERWPKWLLGLLIATIPIQTGFRIAHWYRWEYPWVFRAKSVVATASGSQDLLITNTREHPVLLYHVDRYGFSPALEETGLNVIEEYRKQGATLFLTPRDETWARHPEWTAYFAKHGSLLHQDPDFLLYRLR